MATYPAAAEKKTVVVLGAGVIGLTTGLKIQATGRYQVEIIADVLPTDPKNIKYTSQWAGAHYVSVSPKGTAQADIDRRTFLEFWELSKPGGEAEHCFLRLKQTEYYHSEGPPSDSLEDMPNFTEVPASDLFHRAKCGYEFDTVTIDVPQYLQYLSSHFLARGGRITRGYVQHIDQVLEAGVTQFRHPEDGNAPKSEPPAPPHAIVVCTGLGARTLGGVEDRTVHPVRGQTVLVRAPWIRFGRTFEGDREWTYIIPRRSGDVIIGGTQAEDDWYPNPRPETTADILRRGLELCPELVPPEISAQRPGTTEDLLPIVIEEGCGLRPVRDGGARIEAASPVPTLNGRRVPVVYNYGHGARGYISSIGSAEVALKLLEKELEHV